MAVLVKESKRPLDALNHWSYAIGPPRESVGERQWRIRGGGVWRRRRWLSIESARRMHAYTPTCIEVQVVFGGGVWWAAAVVVVVVVRWWLSVPKVEIKDAYKVLQNFSHSPVPTSLSLHLQDLLWPKIDNYSYWIVVPRSLVENSI